MNVQVRSLRPANPGPIYALDISPNGQQLVLGQQGDDVGSPILSLWNLENLQLLSVIDSSSFGIILSARYSSDGRTLAYINSNFEVCLCDLERRELYKLDLADPHVKWLAFAGKSDRLVTAGLFTHVWDVSRREVIWTLPRALIKQDTKKIPIIADLNPNGTQVAVAGLEPNRIVIYDVDHGGIIQSLEGAPAQARWVSFDPCARCLAAIDWFSHGTFLWDLNSGERFLPDFFNLKTEAYWCLRFHPDCELLALGTLSGFVVIVHLKNGQYVVEQLVHNGRVWDLAFTSDGKHLVSGGDDGIAYVLELDELYR